MLSGQEIVDRLIRWQEAWNAHDLERVMELFADDVVFENWTGTRLQGKDLLRRAWASWFARHGGFRFDDREIFVDEGQQKALYRWELTWPSPEKGWRGRMEKREGVDVLHFAHGKIVRKLTYCKTSVVIEGEVVRLVAEPPRGRPTRPSPET